MRRSVGSGKAVLALFTVSLALGACKRAENPLSSIETAVVTKQDILVSVEATGIIEPADAIQVKSKASGQITKMPIVAGSKVKPGDLLVQVDSRQMQSQHDAAVAALQAAEQNLDVQKSQLAREDSLFAQRVITAVEHEAAAVTHANALSAVANARNNVEISSINLADATVRSPVAGTVIEKNVSLGQVIASATNIVGGGTTLVTVADLSRVLDSALVNESDIGRVKIGQDVSVTVDAYPGQSFSGRVLRISPQAIVQQSVTSFPVLITIDNKEGLLMPGMSADATISVTKLVGVVSVPNDAIGSLQEAATLAAVLGIGQQSLDSAMSAKAPVQQGAPAAQQQKRAGPVTESGGEVSRAGETITRAVVFVRDSASGSFKARVVTLSSGNYEVAPVLSGLEPGEHVALLSDVRVAASRDTTLQRVQGRAGISGMTGGGGAGAAAGTRGGRGGGAR